MEIKLETKDRDDLERLHYRVHALIALIRNVGAKDELVEEFCDVFRLYDKQKDFVTEKYVPEEFRTENHTWQADFENCLLRVC